MTSTSTVNTLSGPYILNFAYMDGSGNLSNITNSATVTFNPSAKTLTVNGTTYTYDFSWGKDGNNILVLGSGGVNGGYYVISDSDVDLSKYTYENNSYGSDNNWTVISTDGTTTKLPFDQSGNSGFDPCFLAGTEISACGSLQKVEDLAVGGQIDVFVNGQEKRQTISWVGKSHCNVRPHLPDDEAGYPVRILKDAITDGVPFKDMLITAEHCLFFDGKFIPARMLVNGRSIFFDKSITSYDYYHVETEKHSVIMADGMLTESYLDTGNRRSFSQTGNVISISGSRNLTWEDAAVPLTVSRETIEPIFRKIETRANKAGFALQTKATPLTNDSDLHLTTNTGAIIRPARQNNGRTMFMIPSDIQSVRIVSNASRPCDVIGPFVDDRRQLGVLIGAITLFESNRTRTVTNHLHDTSLSGWNNVEDSTMRWTQGNALLPLEHLIPGSTALLAIEVRAAGPYILDDTIAEQQVRQA